MWIGTGALLGLFCLVILVGFHVGPHAHGIAVAIGVLLGGWLIYLMVDRGPGPLLWTLLGVDLVVGAGVATLAWRALRGAVRRQRAATDVVRSRVWRVSQ